MDMPLSCLNHSRMSMEAIIIAWSCVCVELYIGIFIRRGSKGFSG